MHSLLTESRLSTFRRCFREHFYAYEKGIRSVETGKALSFGIAIHAALEVWWSERSPTRALDAIPKLEDEFAWYAARALVVGYYLRWEKDGFETIAVEQQYEVPILAGWSLAGKIDAIATDANGRKVIVEHKTTSWDIAPGSSYWKKLPIDGQVSGYFIGAGSLGHAVQACIYDVIRKPSLRPYKATPADARKYKKDGTLYANQREKDETPPEFGARVVEDIAENPDRYYQRMEIVRLERDMDSYRADAFEYVSLIDRSRLNGAWPKNGNSCVRFNSECSYLGVCLGEDSIDNRERFVQLSWPHPELKRNPKEEEAK